MSENILKFFNVPISSIVVPMLLSERYVVLTYIQPWRCEYLKKKSIFVRSSNDEKTQKARQDFSVSVKPVLNLDRYICSSCSSFADLQRSSHVTEQTWCITNLAAQLIMHSCVHERKDGRVEQTTTAVLFAWEARRKINVKLTWSCWLAHRKRVCDTHRYHLLIYNVNN